MMRKPIYSDLDNVLVVAETDPLTGEPVDALVRPGVDEFLAKLSKYGDVHLLTWASRGWANKALWKIGPAAGFFKSVTSREDLLPIALQVEVVDTSEGLRSQDREELYRVIQPILPSGVIFDDFPVGSDMYKVKALATGIHHVNPNLWIQVDAYTKEDPEDRGLERAYSEFMKRNAAWRTPSVGRKKTRSA